MPKGLDEKQIVGVQRLLSLLDPDSLTKEMFVENFKTVVDFSKKSDDKLVEAVGKMLNAFKELSDKNKNDNELSKSELIALIKSEVSKMLSTSQSKNDEIDIKVSQIKDGVDGKDADEEVIVGKVLGQIKIPEIQEIKNDLPKMGEQIRDALELLSGDERIDASAIKGIKENKNLGRVSGGGLNVGSWAIRTIDNELVGTGDGIETDFDINHTPSPSTSLHVKVGTVELFLTEDFTYSAKTITFLTAPPNGAKIRVDYRRA